MSTMEKMLQKQYLVASRDSKKVVAEAKRNLGIAKSCVWSSVLKEECLRLCQELDLIKSNGEPKHRTLSGDRTSSEDAAVRTKPSDETSQQQQHRLHLLKKRSEFVLTRGKSASSLSSPPVQRSSSTENLLDYLSSDDSANPHNSERLQNLGIPAASPKRKGTRRKRSTSMYEKANSPSSKDTSLRQALLTSKRTSFAKRKGSSTRSLNNVSSISLNSNTVKNNKPLEPPQRTESKSATTKLYLNPFQEYMHEFLLPRTGVFVESGSKKEEETDNNNNNKQRNQDEGATSSPLEIFQDNAAALRRVRNLNRNNLSGSIASLLSTAAADFDDNSSQSTCSSSRFDVGKSFAPRRPLRRNSMECDYSENDNNRRSSRNGPSPTSSSSSSTSTSSSSSSSHASQRRSRSYRTNV